MKNEKLLNAMGKISNELIEDAAITTGKKRHAVVWVRWAAIVACLCLVVSIAISFLHIKAPPGNQDFFSPGSYDSIPPGSHDYVHAIAALEYNGKFYEVVDIPEVLEKFGLPSEITADVAGEHLSYLKSDGGVSYEYAANDTEIELYQYAPSMCDGVYVLRDGDTWYAALFCNFFQLDSSTKIELTELYRVYGIERADDIASIAEMNWDKSKVVGTPVTARQEITEFYDMTVTLWSYSNDDFQKLMFGGFSSEDSQQQAHIAFADDYRCLRIETTGGLRFFIGLHPNFDWIDGGGTMSYFKIDEQMHEWIDRNLS